MDEVEATVNFSASQSLLLFNSTSPLVKDFMGSGQNMISERNSTPE